MTAFSVQLGETVSDLQAATLSYGGSSGEQCAISAQPLVEWSHWYRTNRPTESAPELLIGLRAAIIEAAGYCGLGLGRAAISAIRTQIDLMLGYTYFREHPAEWRLVCETGEGFKLKGDLLKYHKEIRPEFAQKLTFVEQATGLSLDKVYRLLSAHIHGQSKFTISTVAELKELVWPEDRIQEVVKLQADAAKVVSSFLLAAHSHEWSDLPQNIVKAVKDVLSPAQVAVFFS